MDAQEQIWNLANLWQHYHEPMRPSSSEVAIVKEYVQSNIKILLLGSTPEYRDFFAENNMDVTVVDYNKFNYDAMTLLMKHQPKQETFVEKNWLDLVCSNKYDLIIGDHIINLLALEKWQPLLNKLTACLKTNGKLLQRVIIAPEDYSKDLYDIFASGKNISNDKLVSQTFYDLIFSTLDQDTHSTNLNRVWEKVNQAYKENLLSQEQLAIYEKFSWQDNHYSAYFTSQSYLLKLLQQHFENNTIIQGDIYYKNYTFFILSE